MDIWVKLFDVAPDGTTFNLMSPASTSCARATAMAGRRRKLLRPGRVYPIRFENLMTGNTFRKGHRLQLVVFRHLFPALLAQPADRASEIVSAASRPDRIAVHHFARHPSRLVLPVVP